MVFSLLAKGVGDSFKFTLNNSFDFTEFISTEMDYRLDYAVGSNLNKRTR